jgi:FtsX-like permease family
VIGVLPAGAWTIRDAQFFIPVVLNPDRPRAQRSPHWGVVFGRLRADASVPHAESELKSIKLQLNDQYPGFKREWSVGLRPLRELLASDPRPVLLMLLGAVLSIRMALGAVRRDIVVQILLDGLRLSGLGLVLGLAGALGAAGLVANQLYHVKSYDPSVLSSTILAVAAVTIGAILVPAWKATRFSAIAALRSE